MAVTRQELETLTVSSAATQWVEIVKRPAPQKGNRQGVFLPVEQVLAYAAMFVVDPASQGGGDWTRYHPLLQLIGKAVRRSPGSVSNKGLNLRGTRARGQRHEQEIYAALGRNELPFLELYRTVFEGARVAGVDESALPDFLGIAHGAARRGDLFVGEEELYGEDLEREAALLVDYDGTQDPETIGVALAEIRVGQARFARQVLENYQQRCGFCGLDGRPLSGHRLTVASHVKPWRSSTPRQRLDPRNGVAACPTHDAAFDTGLMTIRADGRIAHAGKLSAATSGDPIAATAFTVREHLLVPEGSRPPRTQYLEWHHQHIWVNHELESTQVEAEEPGI